MEETWELLRTWASKRMQDGRRAIVPVVGTGLNGQAGVRLSWRDFLVRCQRASALSVEMPKDVTGDTTLVWEAMVLEFARRSGCRPHEAEDQLMIRAAGLLDDLYSPSAVTAPFMRRFLALGFADVLSFNFDRALHEDFRGWHAVGTSLPASTGASFSKTRSYAVLGAHGTRVWYPHGSVMWPDQIQLGVRRYGTYFNELEGARRDYKAHERKVKQELFPEKFSGSEQSRHSTAAERERLWYAIRADAKTWLPAAMNAPIVFLGMSLGREEWPLWWLLNQRARNHAMRGIDVPVFVFVQKPEADRLRQAAQLVRLRLLEFDSFPEGWERFFDAFADK